MNTEDHIDDFREIMREHDGSVSSDYLVSHTDVQSREEAKRIIEMMWGRGIVAKCGYQDEWVLMRTNE